jgi:hypothetical protein
VFFLAPVSTVAKATAEKTPMPSSGVVNSFADLPELRAIGDDEHITSTDGI